LTIVVLLILAGIWAAVLVPPLVRAKADGRPADSIGDFRRQLGVLQRTGPITVSPANRLRVGPYVPSGGAGLPSPVARPAHAMGANPVSRSVVARSPESMRRARTLKRRRDVLFSLVAMMGATLLLGFLPGFRLLWALHAVLDVAFAGYIALLVRMRNMAAERDMKLHFLPGHAQVEPAPVRLRSAN
jgi:hypothetical protein